MTLEGSATTATTTRDNNTQMINGLYSPGDANARTTVGALVDSINPYSGLCYTSTGQPTTCNFAGGGAVRDDRRRGDELGRTGDRRRADTGRVRTS